MKNVFTKHPHSIGESYLQHMKFATLFGIHMMLGGLACFIHAFVPFLFHSTGSNMLLTLTHNFVERMPGVEERVLKLAALIEAKKAKLNNSVAMN